MDALTCPACSAHFPLPSGGGQEVVCPACMHSFTPPELAKGLPLWMEVEVQGPEGEALGRWDRHRVRERIYSGQLRGKERIRGPDGVSWMPIHEREEFAQVLRLAGVDVASLRAAGQQVKGWVQETAPAQPQAISASVNATTAQGWRPTPLQAGLGIGLLIGLVVAILALSQL